MPGVIKTRQWIILSGLRALTVTAILGLVLTRNSSSPTPQPLTGRAPLVDEQSVQSARGLMYLASSREEQRFAQQAWRLAHHAVDLALPTRSARPTFVRLPPQAPDCSRFA